MDKTPVIIICSVLSFLLSVIIIPIVIRTCKKNNWYDTINSRKVHEGLIPRLGSIGIFISFGISLIVYNVINSIPVWNIWQLFIAGLIIFIFGVLDDFINLNPYFKVTIQIISAALVTFSSFYLHTIFGITLPVFIGRVVTFLWIILLVNSFNLIDGLDLLCGGISFLTLLTGGIYLLIAEQPLGLTYFLLCSSILGFLIYNKPPAKIFLGDGGSQTLGYFVSIIPLFPIKTNLETINIFAFLLLVSIPCTDVIAAIWRRIREHRSFFTADRGHIHHKLVNIGFSKIKASMFLLSLQAVICIIVLLSLFMINKKDAIILLAVSILLIWIFFSTLHYINRSVNIKHTGHLDEAPQKK